MVNLLSYGLMAQAELAGVPDPSMAGVLENEVGSWGAAFISIGLVVSLLGALIAWVLLCVEILRLPALEHVMPKALAKENAHGAPANALWLTNLCVQALLLWTLANASTYTNLVYLATSLILLPYLWSAAYQVLLAVRGETYDVRPRAHPRPRHRRGRARRTRCGWCMRAAGSTCWLRRCSTSSGPRCTSGRAGKAACLRSPDPNWLSSRSWR